MDKKIYGKIKKRKYNRKYTHAKIVFLALLIGVAVIGATEQYTIRHIDSFKFPSVEAKEPVKEEMVMDYIWRRLGEEKIDRSRAMALIACESKFNTEATLVNKNNNGIDRGIWQINSKYHPEVSYACAYDYKCATENAIRIIKVRGFKEWTCGK